MIIEQDLKFLNGKVVIYYAGLDDESLPFSEGKKLILETADDQITYLKALSLVTDYIVVPPSFYFYWSKYIQSKMSLNTLLKLYEANIVISPIHLGMNCGSEFLQHKLASKNIKDKKLIKSNWLLIHPFFRRIPVLHRNVGRQSKGFKTILLEELDNQILSAEVTDRINDLLAENQKYNISISRNSLETKFEHLFKNKTIDIYEFRKLYYATNKSYYKQGAKTYCSSISILGAERYSILGKDMFIDDNSILLAYDPFVLIGILECFGINKKIISQLTVEEIVKIRDSPVFDLFKIAYKSFAEELQRLEIITKRVSKVKLNKLKSEIFTKFMKKYLREMRFFENKKDIWNLSEMMFFAIALGSVGFIVIPLVGAILGLLPIIVYKIGLTPSLSKFVINNMNEKEIVFFRFIEVLNSIVNEVEESLDSKENK